MILLADKNVDALIIFVGYELDLSVTPDKVHDPCPFPSLLQYIHVDIVHGMKPVRFLGDSLKCLRAFPRDAKQDAGRQIDKVQRGGQPDDFKPMPTIGRGVEELRVWDDSGTFRVIYTARLPDAIYILHAFQKKTQTTSKRDLELAKTQFSRLTRGEP